MPTRISQSILYILLCFCFLILLPALKVISLFCPLKRVVMLKDSYWLSANKDDFTNSLLPVSKLSVRLKFHQHKYLAILAFIIVLFSKFFSREKMSGKISSAVYEMN